jgi:hypothetical protein
VRRLLNRRLVIGLVIGWLVVVFLPLMWLHAHGYDEYATGLQAFGLVLALGLGVWTIDSGTRSQAVDRSLALHAELTTGETDRARRRLARHLRDHAVAPLRVRSATVTELRDDPSLNEYATEQYASPAEDAVLVLRFFERVRLAQVSGSLDDPMTAELIGRHAAWWNLALISEDHTSRRALGAFADWANQFAKAHAGRYPYLAKWGTTRLQDFGQA